MADPSPEGAFLRRFPGMADILRAGGQVQFPPGFDPNDYPTLEEAREAQEGEAPALREATPAERAASQSRMATPTDIDFDEEVDFDAPVETAAGEIDFDEDLPETENARGLAQHRWDLVSRRARARLVGLQPLPQTEPKRVGTDPAYQPIPEGGLKKVVDGKLVDAPWRRRFENLQRDIVRLAGMPGDVLNNVIEANIAGRSGDMEEADARMAELGGTGKGLVQGALQTPLAFAGSHLGDLDPTGTVGPLLDEQGIGPQSFRQMMEEAPATTTMGVVGAPGVGMALKGAPKGAPLERGLSAGDLRQADTLRQAKAGVDQVADTLARMARKEEVRKGQEAAKAAAKEASEGKANPVIPEPSEGLLAHDKALLENVEFQKDLTVDSASPVENRFASTPSQAFKAWSMEKGFDTEVATSKEWSDWLDQRVEHGFTLTDQEINSRAKTAKAFYEAENKRTGTDKRLKKGKGKGKKTTTASFMGTQELYDIAAHFASKIPDYAKWVGEMIKHVGQIGADRLRAIWQQVRSALEFDKVEGPKIREAIKVERRANPLLRAAVSQRVGDWRNAGKTFIEATNAISDAKAMGKISGAEESILLREAQAQYSRNMATGLGEESLPTGTKFSAQDMHDMTQQAGKLLEDPVQQATPSPWLGAKPTAPVGPALDPHLATMVKEATDSGAYSRSMLEQMVENLGGDPEAYLPPVAPSKKRGPVLDSLGGQQLYEGIVKRFGKDKIDGLADQVIERLDAGEDLPSAVEKVVGDRTSELSKAVEVNARGGGRTAIEEVFGPKKKKKGMTLSTLGGQELYERTVELAVDIGRSLRARAVGYDDWSQQVRALADADGIELTDAQLRDAWERGRPIPAVTQAGAVVNTAEQAAAVAQDTSDFGQSLFGITRPGMRAALLRTAPKVAERATELIQSKQTSALMAKHDFDAIFDILREGVTTKAAKGKVQSFIDILHDYRARSLNQKAANIASEQAALNQELASLGPEDGLRRLQIEAELEELVIPPAHRFESLTPEQRISLMEDPQIAAAVAWWDKNVRPRIERESVGANIRTRLTAEGGPDLYARMHWRPIEGSGLRNPGPRRGRTKSRSALEAKGDAPEQFELSRDLEQILYDTYEQRLTPAATRRLNEAMAEPGVRQNPDAVAAYELAMNKAPDILDNKVIHAVQALGTVPMLMLPAEATMHALGVLGTAGRIVWGKKLPTRAIETLGGIWGKQAIAIKRAMSLGGPDFAAQVERWNKVGLLRAHGMSKLMEHKSLSQKLTDVPGLRIPKKIVFGHPGYSRFTLAGLETRYRIAMAEAIQSIDPSMSDAVVAHHINNAVGTYVSKLAPQLAKYTAPMTAFSRARTALPKSAVNYMIGRNIHGKFSADTALNHAWSLVMTTTIAARLLDSKGEWWWEKKGWSPRRPIVIDLEDGRRVEVPLNLINNASSRALQTTGINNAIEAYIKGERSAYKLGAEIGRGVYNYGASFMGPHMNTLAIGLTGHGFYETQVGPYSPEIPTMQGAKFSPGQARMRAMLESWFPPLAKVSNTLPDSYGGDSGKEAHPHDPTWDVVYTIGKAFGIAPMLREAGFEQRAKRGLQPVTEAEFRDVFFKTLGEARNIEPSKRTKWVMDRIENNFSDAIVMTPKGPKPANVAAMELMKLVPMTPKRDAMGGVLNEINAP